MEIIPNESLDLETFKSLAKWRSFYTRNPFIRNHGTSINSISFATARSAGTKCSPKRLPAGVENVDTGQVRATIQSSELRRVETHWNYNAQMNIAVHLGSASLLEALGVCVRYDIVPTRCPVGRYLKFSRVFRLCIAFNHNILVLGLGDRLHSVSAFHT